MYKLVELDELGARNQRVKLVNVLSFEILFFRLAFHGCPKLRGLNLILNYVQSN